MKAGFRTAALKSDITDTQALEKEILAAAPDLVIHLAGISFVPSKDQEAFYKVHALGTGNLLDALCKLPKIPQKILLASSATVYGNSPNPQSVETQALSPIDHYAISKVAMEESAKTYFDRLPIIIARPFNYTGKGQHSNFLIPKLIEHFAERRPSIELGNLNVEREFNDVSMVCHAYLGLLKYGNTREIYNVSTGNARSLKLVLETLIDITGHPLEIKVNTDFVRTNEIHRMCGDPKKLFTLFNEVHNPLYIPSLEDTLQEMLNAKRT